VDEGKTVKTKWRLSWWRFALSECFFLVLVKAKMLESISMYQMSKQQAIKQSKVNQTNAKQRHSDSVVVVVGPYLLFVVRCWLSFSTLCEK